MIHHEPKIGVTALTQGRKSLIFSLQVTYICNLIIEKNEKPEIICPNRYDFTANCICTYYSVTQLQ